MSALQSEIVGADRDDRDPSPAPVRPSSLVTRWAPFTAAAAVSLVVLLITGTSIVDIARYAAYATLAVALPGTLVYRSLRRTPHTFVEDVAMGTALGLTLELAGWAVFAAAHLQAWMALWPLAVVVPFAAVPRLRRHWRVRGYTPTPLAWSWTVAGVVAFFVIYLWSVFLARNPILPTSDDTRQYLDLAYQLSLAGDAKHTFPLQLPQVAGEPLYYHWFGYAHMASSSLVGHIDLPVVALRFAVPGLCAAAIVLTAVVGWRVTGRPWAGAVAAVLFWVIGEFEFVNPSTQPFGTEATFVIWHGMSMIYSWVLLIAAIAPLAEAVGRRAGHPVPAQGRGLYVTAALLLFASSGAKASSLPVVLGAIGLTGLGLLVVRRRIPWAVVGIGLIAVAAQAFAAVVLFHMQTYGLKFGPFHDWSTYWIAARPRPAWKQRGLELAVLVAFLVNMELRVLGVAPLMWIKRLRLEPAQWFLLAGGMIGPVFYVSFTSVNAEYFTRSGFAFGVLLSAWGYVLVFDRARLSGRGKAGLLAASVAVAVVLSVAQILFARPQPSGERYSALIPIWTWAGVLGAAGLVAVAIWLVIRRWLPRLRGAGAIVALTMALVAGAPGLIMDQAKSWATPNGGPYYTVPLPKSRVDAARWVRAHSSPGDILATNSQCLNIHANPLNGPACDARGFWLSAYSERSVLVEGWMFAPRTEADGNRYFWDPQKLRVSDEAITDPSAGVIDELRQTYHVRWLVVDRAVAPESPRLSGFASKRYDNGRVAVYQLGRSS